MRTHMNKLLFFAFIFLSSIAAYGQDGAILVNRATGSFLLPLQQE